MTAARSVLVTSAQSVTPGIASRIASRTSGVRSQIPAAVTVALSVAAATPLTPPRPVTVRVNVNSVPAASAGIVTAGVALAASSNVTDTPLAGSLSAQP